MGPINKTTETPRIGQEKNTKSNQNASLGNSALWNQIYIYSRDYGLVQAPRLNAGSKKQKKAQNQFFFRKKNKNYLNFVLDFPSSYAKILGKQIFSHGSFPEVGEKQKA